MKTEQELKEMCKCPYCGSDKPKNFSIGNGGDEYGDILFYTAQCKDCGKKVVSAYRWLGFMKVEDFNALDTMQAVKQEAGIQESVDFEN